MKKYQYLLLLFISIMGVMLIYWFWPQNGKLPILDKVSNFKLEEVHGKAYELDNNKIKLISFFYTDCPDICPTTMMDFKDLQEELKAQGLFNKEVELVSISIAPQIDTTQVIKDYAANFEADSSGWKWLKGTPVQTKKIADELQMQYKELEGGFFSHSITMYLVDKENRVRALYDMAGSGTQIEKDSILKDIQILAKNS